MSRASRINPAIAALDSEIRQAEKAHREHERKASEALAVLMALTAARDRIGAASPVHAARSAKPWKPRGPVEKAIVQALGHDVRLTAEALRDATGAAAPSLKAALARMKEAGAVTVGEGDRYSLAGGEMAEAAQ